MPDAESGIFFFEIVMNKNKIIVLLIALVAVFAYNKMQDVGDTKCCFCRVLRLQYSSQLPPDIYPLSGKNMPDCDTIHSRYRYRLQPLCLYYTHR